MGCGGQSGFAQGGTRTQKPGASPQVLLPTGELDTDENTRKALNTGLDLTRAIDLAELSEHIYFDEYSWQQHTPKPAGKVHIDNIPSPLLHTPSLKERQPRSFYCTTWSGVTTRDFSKHTHTHTHTWKRTHTEIHTFTHTHTHTHTHIHTHTFTHTHTS
jgi:hypothetical protein